MADWIETYANMHRGKNTIPVRIERPWLKASRATAPRQASAESVARRARLAAQLGLHD